MRLFTLRGMGLLMFAVLFATLFGSAVFAQSTEKPGVAVYVVGDIPDNEKKILGKYLLAALINSGKSESAENSEAFLAAAGEDQAKRGGAVSKERVCELGRQFSIRYICAASVTPAFGFFEISARMVDTESEEIIFKGEAQSPLKTIEDLTQASKKIVEDMLGAGTSDAQAESKPEPAQSAAAAGAPASAVSVTGEAKAAVDKVVAAVNAFKDATDKSIAAANAVKTATQSKNFSAIMDAKKKVESATEAVKKAKADVTAAINILNSAGPEAAEAVKAQGIDVSMFGGTDGSGTTQTADNSGNGENTSARRTKNGFMLGYVLGGDIAANIFQAGFTQARPIGETGLSFVWESNAWVGMIERDTNRWGENYNDKDDRDYVAFGLNIPLLLQFDVSVLSLETGVQAVINILNEMGGADVNAGFVVGGGIRLGFAKFFYRFNYGTAYYSQMFGIRMMF
ncbi:hypothetical protein R80B4_00838 [Fibrobacteres bacterium R8-0-B4]